jgi:hypothetical protein
MKKKRNVDFGFSIAEVRKMKSALADILAHLCAEWSRVHESD